MPFEVILKPEAVKDLDGLRKYEAASIADAIERHLRIAPQSTSRTRIKRLRGQQEADFRLRVGNFRVFYTIDDIHLTVFVLRIMHKERAVKFYKEEGP
jgi:mRNA-degrading endonuclease RelE of RelBE toxin-antitoxin system